MPKSKISFYLCLLLTAFCFLAKTSLAQSIFIPGQSYLDSTNYVEYIAGNMPIIICAPHGGYLAPEEIPDRTSGVTSRDLYTQELARGVQEEFFEENGCYPHVIINLLHRKKFDANRDIAEAADGNPTVEAAWVNFHEFIQVAKNKVVQDYQRGLFLDFHGHSHKIPRIEFGYAIWGSQLRQSDDMLNSTNRVQQSSIRTLVGDNLESLTHAELLRGNLSFGTLMGEKGYPSVPSMNDPFPMDGEAYFSGGFNTVRHGSREGGNIDAIQLEFNNMIRTDEDLRAALITDVSICIREYMSIQYGDKNCSMLDLDNDGFISSEDCDDMNGEVNPGQIEIPYNGLDDDCNEATLDDDLDEDGFDLAEDCDDCNPNINPDAIEIPNNDIDEDCNGEDLMTKVHQIQNKEIRIYPNPTSDYIYIETDAKFEITIILYDISGKVIFRIENSVELDLRELSAGTYILELYCKSSNESSYEVIKLK